MVDIQEIFNRVIDNGFYANRDVVGMCSQYMCYSLEYANSFGFITDDEMNVVRAAIKEYLSPTGCDTLRVALEVCGHSGKFDDRMVIYEDWKNRPTLKG